MLDDTQLKITEPSESGTSESSKGLKTCTKCKKTKPIRRFHIIRSKSGRARYRRGECILCYRTSQNKRVSRSRKPDSKKAYPVGKLQKDGTEYWYHFKRSGSRNETLWLSEDPCDHAEGWFEWFTPKELMTLDGIDVNIEAVRERLNSGRCIFARNQNKVSDDFFEYALPKGTKDLARWTRMIKRPEVGGKPSMGCNCERHRGSLI